MNRGVITISESGTVSMPTDTVWMTMQEIADMYNVFGCYVRKAVKAIFKDGILKEQGVRRHVRKNDRISYDVYSLELVIAVAFRIDSIESRAFREFIMQSVIGKCPHCGGDIRVGTRAFNCSNYSNQQAPCNFAIWRNIGGHQLSLTEAKEICEKEITSNELEMYRDDGTIYRKRLGLSPDKLQIVKI